MAANEASVQRSEARWAVVVAGFVVLIAGAATRGSKRWIDVGFFKFQPSEFGKVLFVLALAGFLSERSRSIADPRVPLKAPGYGLPPWAWWAVRWPPSWPGASRSPTPV